MNPTQKKRQRQLQAEPEEDNSANFETDGVSIKNAQERIQNAQASYENARKKMTQASMEASELRKQNEALQAQLEKRQEWWLPVPALSS